MRNSCVILVLLFQGCGPVVGYESLEADAKQYCGDLAVCEELPDPADYAARCANGVLDDGEVARDEGEACARALEALVHCFADLSCEAHKEWRAHYAEDDQSVAYPCADQTDEFLDECEKTWFTENIKR